MASINPHSWIFEQPTGFLRPVGCSQRSEMKKAYQRTTNKFTSFINLYYACGASSSPVSIDTLHVASAYLQRQGLAYDEFTLFKFQYECFAERFDHLYHLESEVSLNLPIQEE